MELHVSFKLSERVQQARHRPDRGSDDTGGPTTHEPGPIPHVRCWLPAAEAAGSLGVLHS